MPEIMPVKRWQAWRVVSNKCELTALVDTKMSSLSMGKQDWKLPMFSGKHGWIFALLCFYGDAHSRSGRLTPSEVSGST